MSPPVLYGLSAMAASMLHSVFVSFFIDYFVRLHLHSGGVSEGAGEGSTSGTVGLSAFVVGQAVYAVWNSVNDLGFGWFGDTHHDGAIAGGGGRHHLSIRPQQVFSVLRFSLRQSSGAGPRLLRSLCGEVGVAVGAVALLVLTLLFRVFVALPRESLRVAVDRRRLGRIALGGPLWAASFALLWIPIPVLRDVSPSLELSIKLIVYDGFFSLTTVSFRALLVDIATSAKEREWCTMYAAGFQLAGSVGVVFASYWFESASTAAPGASSSAALGVSNSSLWPFRTFCIVWAVLAAMLFLLSSSLARTETRLQWKSDAPKFTPNTPSHTNNASPNSVQLNSHSIDDATLAEGEAVSVPLSGVRKEEQEELTGKEPGSSPPSEESVDEPPQLALLPFLRQTIQRPSMKAVLVVWNLQEYSCTFATNFFGMFLATVAAHELSPPARSSLLFASFVVPHLVTISITPSIIPTYGKKTVIGTLFLLRSAVGVAVLALAWSGLTLPIAVNESASPVPRRTAWCFAGLLLLNRILTEAVCRLQPLVLSDVCDEDTVVFNRPLSMAGAINGMVALVSRPSQSLAPVLSCLWLAHAGILRSAAEEVPSSAGVPPQVASWYVMVLLGSTILGTTLGMFVVWRAWYGLEGAHLRLIQQSMQLRTVKAPA